VKRLVLCCDGTWNAADQERDGVPCPTNVVKLGYRVAKRDAGGTLQVIYYDQGVGTGNVVDRMSGGAFGRGVEDNIHDAYRFLIANYEPGDEIFLFGFSRGAFTVRSIGGMIRKCGILARPFVRYYRAANELYRNEEHPDDPGPTKFRHDYSVLRAQAIPIKLIGVWDTVGSLGIPLRGLRSLTRTKYQFHDTELSGTVQFAFHALAIDEHRAPFEPTLWAYKPKPAQHVEQVEVLRAEPGGQVPVLQVQHRHQPVVAHDRGAQECGGRLLAQVPVRHEPAGQLLGPPAQGLAAPVDVLDDGLGYPLGGQPLRLGDHGDAAPLDPRGRGEAQPAVRRQQQRAALGVGVFEEQVQQRHHEPVHAQLAGDGLERPHDREQVELVEGAVRPGRNSGERRVDVRHQHRRAPPVVAVAGPAQVRHRGRGVAVYQRVPAAQLGRECLDRAERLLARGVDGTRVAGVGVLTVAGQPGPLGGQQRRVRVEGTRPVAGPFVQHRLRLAQPGQDRLLAVGARRPVLGRERDRVVERRDRGEEAAVVGLRRRGQGQRPRVVADQAGGDQSDGTGDRRATRRRGRLDR